MCTCCLEKPCVAHCPGDEAWTQGQGTMTVVSQCELRKGDWVVHEWRCSETGVDVTYEGRVTHRASDGNLDVVYIRHGVDGEPLKSTIPMNRDWGETKMLWVREDLKTGAGKRKAPPESDRERGPPVGNRNKKPKGPSDKVVAAKRKRSTTLKLDFDAEERASSAAEDSDAGKTQPEERVTRKRIKTEPKRDKNGKDYKDWSSRLQAVCSLVAAAVTVVMSRCVLVHVLDIAEFSLVLKGWLWAWFDIVRVRGENQVSLRCFYENPNNALIKGNSAKNRRDQARRHMTKLVKEAQRRREADRVANSYANSPLPSSQQNISSPAPSSSSRLLPEQQASTQPAFDSPYGFLTYTDHLAFVAAKLCWPFVWFRANHPMRSCLVQHLLAGQKFFADELANRITVLSNETQDAVFAHLEGQDVSLMLDGGRVMRRNFVSFSVSDGTNAFCLDNEEYKESVTGDRILESILKYIELLRRSHIFVFSVCADNAASMQKALRTLLNLCTQETEEEDEGPAPEQGDDENDEDSEGEVSAIMTAINNAVDRVRLQGILVYSSATNATRDSSRATKCHLSRCRAQKKFFFSTSQKFSPKKKKKFFFGCGRFWKKKSKKKNPKKTIADGTVAT